MNKLFIAADHAGFDLKEEIKIYFKAHSNLNKKRQLIDLGAEIMHQDDDYPDFAFKLGKEVCKNKENLGILVCRSGIGMSIAANKILGIRAALCTSVGQAVTSRAHNDCNVLVLASEIDQEENFRIMETFLGAEFSNEDRHKRRIEKIIEYEKGGRSG